MAVSQSWKQIRIDPTVLPTVLPTSSSAEQHRVNSGDWKILEDIGRYWKILEVGFKMFKEPLYHIYLKMGLSESQVTPPRPPMVLPKYQRFSGDHMPHSRCGGAWNSQLNSQLNSLYIQIIQIIQTYSVLMSSKIIVALKNALTFKFMCIMCGSKSFCDLFHDHKWESWVELGFRSPLLMGIRWNQQDSAPMDQGCPWRWILLALRQDARVVCRSPRSCQLIEQFPNREPNVCLWVGYRWI